MTVPESAALLEAHQPRIAAAITRQIQRTVPRYRQLDGAALRRSVSGLLEGLQRLLCQDDVGPLTRLVTDLIQLRRVAGFQTSEVILAGLCFLPVLRRFYLHKAPRPRISLAWFEELEALLIPVLAELMVVAESPDPERAVADLSRETLFDSFFIEEAIESLEEAGAPSNDETEPFLDPVEPFAR